MTHALSAALATTAPTMSSLEIADRTGKSHDNVLRDIRGMLTELHGDALRFEAIYRDSMNRKKPCFELPKHETLVLVTGYSIPMRAAVVSRWQELEAQVAKPSLPNFSDPAAAARAWATEYEAKTAALAQVEVLKPAAALGSLVADHELSLTRVGRQGSPKADFSMVLSIPENCR